MRRSQRDAIATAATEVLAGYLATCDVPRLPSASELATFFSANAVWEGTGDPYGNRFGRVEGRQQIIEMLQSHLPPRGSFVSNVHLLGHGQVAVRTGFASGSWPMLQISTFKEVGRAPEFVSSRLQVDFEVPSHPAIAGVSITHFRTERLFMSVLHHPQEVAS